MATRNRPLANQHQANYRQRRKLALQPIAKPWDWLSLAEVQKLAVQGYRSASFATLPESPTDALSVADFQRSRDDFAYGLTQAFECLVDAAADVSGIKRGPMAKHYAACLREDVPAAWRPQYSFYFEVAPASVLTTPEAVTNADEGNVNDLDLTR
jgi:hypothetical protein